ncbi:Ig-like domain-containing protein [Paenibacillus sediminis]|uniref:Methionine-rich copper-binding protein CopC n=1 Tax=Paenibacillus sediminis TaxID=664909 RepID=A0ABS4H2D0_9BACL|nr:Ig-like domain-containing protein [Paenibacillus sediminis]MBP1936678.1 methionine-rich copper-binding protein CopC [Paenibacillus sediminis]
MSNMSYTKENSYDMKDIQGGEKKVMKKILSVALSTAMAFSMFASVAFGDNSAPSTQQQYDALVQKGVFNGLPDGSAHLEDNMTRAQFAKVLTKLLGLKEVTGVYSYKDKNYGPKNWAAPYIEAVTAAGLMQGKDSVKKIFDFNGNVTIQEVAKVLAIALKLEVPATADNSASDWAKGYVKAAVDAGLIPADANFKGNATRGMLVEAAFKADQLVNTPPAPVVTSATKVESVTADNLKQVTVKFDGTVDKATAGDADNYGIVASVGGATYGIASAVVADDAKSVKLTLVSGKVFTNQDEYKLSFSNVKAGDKVLSTTDYKFNPVDAALPSVTDVQALGNKTVRISFSEPINTANAANLLVDGNPVVGYTTVSGSTVILKLYSALSNGEHTLTVSGATDFAGFKSLSQSNKFNVVEDTQAPTVSVQSATFEKVTLKFSEPVDPSTVLGSNVYWLQGTTKQYAGTTVNQISDDTFEFDFTGKEIRYTTDLYVSGVKDYTGNAIAADTKVQVSPVVDQTRPEVVNATLDDAHKTITIKFSKSLDKATAETASNYVIKDKDGKVVSNLKYPTLQSDNKTVKVVLATALSEGSNYTLEVSGVSDNTTLKNVLLPYSKQLTIGDATGPNVNSTGDFVVGNGNNKLVLTFDEVVATTGAGSAVDPSKYLISVPNGAGGYKWTTLPDGSFVNITPDGKSVVITLPSTTPANTVNQVRVALVTDVAGNKLQGLTQDVNIGTSTASVAQAVYATDNDTLKVTFDKTLLSGTASTGDYRVTSATYGDLSVISATVDGSNVILKLADNSKLDDNGMFKGSAVTVSTNANPSTSTPAGVPIAAFTQGVIDKTAASVAKVVGSVDGSTVTITFNEALNTTLNGNEPTDLVIKDKDGNVLTNYTVTVSGADLTVHFGTAQTGVITVSIQNPRFIKDAAGNVVNASDAIEVEAVKVP